MSIIQPNDLSNILGDWETADYTPKAYPHPSNHTIQNVVGMFDDSFLDVDGVATSQPNFTVDESVIASPENGDQLTIGSVVYTIRNIDFDGHGSVFLILEKNPE